MAEVETKEFISNPTVDMMNPKKDNFTHTEKADVNASKYILSLDKEQFLTKFPLDLKDVFKHSPKKITTKQREKSIQIAKETAFKNAKNMASYIIINKGSYEVKYDYQSVEGCGRQQATLYSIFKNCSKKLRDFLAQNIYTDIDITNSYPTILLKIMKQHNSDGLYNKIPQYSVLQSYVTNRKEILKEAKFDKTDVLKMMMRDNDEPSEDFMIELNMELRKIKKWLWDLSSYPDEWREKATNNSIEKNTHNIKSSFTSYVITQTENILLQKLVQSLGDTQSKILCYDGLMVDGQIPDIVKINQLFKNDGIKWAIKPTDTFEVPEFEAKDYWSMKEIYDETHTFILNTKCPIMVRGKRECIQNSLETEKANTAPMGAGFLLNWVADPDRPQKDRIDFIPISPIQEEKDVIEEGVFNTFMGFKIPYDEKCKPIKNQVFQDYLMNLTTNRQDLANWIYLWVAHIMQKPNENPLTGIILTGTTGTGKTTLYKIITALLGTKYGNSTSDPNQIFAKEAGDNSMMKNVMIVQLEETKGMAGKVICNRLKEFFSAEYLNIRQLYSSPYKQQNNIRMIINSNESRPIPVEPAIVRRVMQLWIQDDLLGGEWFMDNIYGEEGLLQNEDALKELYHELLHTDISSFKVGVCPTPKEQLDCAEEEASPLQQFFFDEFNESHKGDFNKNKCYEDQEGATYWTYDGDQIYMNIHDFVNNFKVWMGAKHFDNWTIAPSQIKREVKRLPSIEIKRRVINGNRVKVIYVNDPKMLGEFIEKMD